MTTTNPSKDEKKNYKQTLNPPQVGSKGSTSSEVTDEQGGDLAESLARTVATYPDLALVVSAWPMLTPERRQAIAAAAVAAASRQGVD